VFLQCSTDDFGHRPVMPEMNHLGAMGLKDAADNVNGRIVAVKQRGRGNKAQRGGVGLAGGGVAAGAGGRAHLSLSGSVEPAIIARCIWPAGGPCVSRWSEAAIMPPRFAATGKRRPRQSFSAGPLGRDCLPALEELMDLFATVE